MPTIHYAPNPSVPKPDIRTVSTTFTYRFWTEKDGKFLKLSTTANTEEEAINNLNSSRALCVLCARIPTN
ncbi:hypothetical protein EX217_10975 [Providencia rettgeri]|uniref:hypothetical protein n=1 Tax=Providencia rettgeri TaxID=587 RepID=UPI001C82A1F3|nr:hypothetical protein [Providencia rettgeri]MBX6968233.1 hypothetical protein [Providencia rettgeri]MBX6978022.1 hypothetical protein [Providencia rettgeri]MBX6994963.1 hypothetical protein [Providencia rettgeri]MBX6996098.1 hypothetical protein [Providencia rettgeri]MBX7023730.1 hypothetical protein [Providencia rettgeri]